MRIALLTPEYVTETNFDGGLANYIHKVSVALCHAGHDVEIFTSSKFNDITTHKTVKVHRINHNIFFCRFLKVITNKRLDLTIDILFRSLFISKRLLSEHKKKTFDIVQTPSFWAPGLFIKVPFVTRISSFEPLWRTACGGSCYLDNALAEWLELVQMRRSKAVYAPSHLLAKIVSKFEPLSIDVIRPPFMPQGVTEDDYEYNVSLCNVKYLLFFGTVCGLKGVELIWRNLSVIFFNNPDIHFVFVGKGKLPPFTDDLFLYQDRIHFFAPMHHEKLFALIKKSTAVILPSIIDNLPNACIESMYLEKVVVATRGASFEEIIEDRITGYLFDGENDADFQMLVSKVCNSTEDELSEVGRRAKLSILEKFDPVIRTEELVQYFNSILNNNGRAT